MSRIKADTSPEIFQLAAMQLPGLARVYWQYLHQRAIATDTAPDPTWSMQAIFSASAEQLQQQYAFPPKLIKQIMSVNWVKIAELRQKISEDSIYFISIESAAYPAQLRAIPDPPLGLFVKGNSALLQQRQLAMVGSRKATQQALALTKAWATQLAQQHIVITSGMALGIDAAAHQGALAAKAGTIAVLGCGLHHIYPKQHRYLWEKILAHDGAIVSEYWPDTPARAAYFPQRNRIISGMSEGVVVLEAATKSGSLITARLANEQGRDVFAVPGSIHNANTSGCHFLIQQGAKLITSVADILTEYAWGQDCLKIQQIQHDISPKEQEILTYISSVALTIDEIVALSGLAFAEVCSILLQLELKKRVTKGPHGYQCR